MKTYIPINNGKIIDYAPVVKFKIKTIEPEKITLMYLMDLWRFTTVKGSTFDKLAFYLIHFIISLPVVVVATLIILVVCGIAYLIWFLFKTIVLLFFALVKPILFPLLIAIGLILVYVAYKISFFTWLIHLFNN